MGVPVGATDGRSVGSLVTTSDGKAVGVKDGKVICIEDVGRAVVASMSPVETERWLQSPSIIELSCTLVT